MTPDTRRLIFRYGIAIDLVVIATAVALLAPPNPALLLGIFFVTIGVVAFVAGWAAGFVSTALSVIVLAITVDFEDFVTFLPLFALAGLLLSGATTRLRSRITGISTPADAHASPKTFPRAARTVAFLGLPFLTLLVYTDLSDILIRNFGIPSLLQPLIAVLAVPVFARRDLFRPAAVALTPITFLLAGYCVLIFTSSVWARETWYADDRLTDVIKGLLIYLLVGSLAFAWISLRRALAAVVIAAALIGSLTILQSVTGKDFGEFGGIARMKQGTLYEDVEERRAGGQVGDPNFYAQVLLIAIPLGVFLAVSEKTSAMRGVWFAAAAVAVLALLLTYSRGGMLALAVVAVLTLIHLRIRPARLAAAAAAVVLLAALVVPGPVWRRFTTVQELLPGLEQPRLDSAVEKRRLVMGAALGMFRDHPIAGVGAGNFTPYYTEYENRVGSPAIEYDPLGSRQYPHSLYMEIAAENGLAGLTLFGAAMIAVLAAMRRSRATLLAAGDSANAALVAGIAVAIVGFLVSSLFLHGSFQRYLWLALGFAAAALKLTGRRERVEA